MITTIAVHQIRLLRRSRVFVATFGILLIMTAVAGVLGWSSHRTIIRVYDEAVRYLASSGKPAPPNPFLLKPPLSVLSNLVVYFPLLGALLALILGHLSVADEESDGVGRLVFSRRVSRRNYVLGKIVGAAVLLLVIMAGCFLVSVGSLAAINQALPSVGEFGRLGLLFGLSWLYLMVFALVGMLTVLLARRRSLALLCAMGVWLVVTFVIPQFTSGLRPTASLNPIVETVSTSQPFFRFTALARPYSIVEQYKEASGRMLGTAAPESIWTTTQRVLPMAGLLVILMVLTLILVRRHDFSRSASNE